MQSFHSRQGKAYLFNAVINVLEGPKEARLMTTGEPAGCPDAGVSLRLSALLPNLVPPRMKPLISCT